jgi:hypothetical protein
MKKRTITIMAVLAAILFAGGCTLPSTKMAQEGSYKSQAVTDGVHHDMFKALSRENYEVAILNVKLEAEKAKQGQPPEVCKMIDAMAQRDIAALTEFAKKRDAMVVWDRDHERANAYKYVTVDAKLFSEQGILNYLGGRISDGAKKFMNSWDAGKQVWVGPATQPASQPSYDDAKTK